MPLKRGTSDKTREANIKELIHSYKQTGRIGNSHPTSKAAAIRQAVAIGYEEQRRAMTKKGGK